MDIRFKEELNRVIQNLKKNDSAELDEAMSSLQLMEKYAKEILVLGKVSPEKAKDIAEKLVNDFLIHEEVINNDKAKELGLNIIDDYIYKEEWEILRNWLGRYLLKSSDKHIIRYYISKECQLGENKNERKGNE